MAVNTPHPPVSATTMSASDSSTFDSAFIDSWIVASAPNDDSTTELQSWSPTSTEGQQQTDSYDLSSSYPSSESASPWQYSTILNEPQVPPASPCSDYSSSSSTAFQHSHSSNSDGSVDGMHLQYDYSKSFPNAYALSNPGVYSAGSPITSTAPSPRTKLLAAPHVPRQTMLKPYPHVDASYDVSPPTLSSFHVHHPHSYNQSVSSHHPIPPQTAISFNPHESHGARSYSIPYPLFITPSDLLPSSASPSPHEQFADFDLDGLHRKRKRPVSSAPMDNALQGHRFIRRSTRPRKVQIQGFSSEPSPVPRWSDSESVFSGSSEEADGDDDEWVLPGAKQSSSRSRRAASSSFARSGSMPLSVSGEEKLFTKAGAERKNRPIPLPVPIPNLTKKSRGRKVPVIADPSADSATPSPTISSSVNDASSLFSHDEQATEYSPQPQPAVYSGSRRGQASGPRKIVEKAARNFTCNVPGCGKGFVRGEHLKRHVRSIHTYEKPHVCPQEGCGKSFSRRDNLAQHFRVHMP